MIILLIANLQNKYFLSSSRQIRVLTPQVRVRLCFFACVTCRTLLFAKLQKSCVIIKVLHIALFRQNAIREKNKKFKFKFICISQIKKKYEFLDDFEFSIKCAIHVNHGRFCSLPVVQCVNYINS